MLTELQATFKGNVQGVGFRYTTAKQATTLGLKGIVKNMPDGSVELIAQGTKEHLQELVDYLVHEAFEDHITDINLAFKDAVYLYSDFKSL